MRMCLSELGKKLNQFNYFPPNSFSNEIKFCNERRFLFNVSTVMDNSIKNFRTFYHLNIFLFFRQLEKTFSVGVHSFLNLGYFNSKTVK